MRMLSLAAATAPAATRTDVVHNAAAAGFDAVGLRFDLDPPSRPELRSIRRALDETGLVLLDVEVVRIGTHDGDTIAAVADAAAELGARHLLAVSDASDPGETVAALHQLSAGVRGAGVRVAVEFMAFTAIATLAHAVDIVDATGDESIGILVDPLHLARSGGRPAQLASVDRGRLHYAQLCDAPAEPPAGGIDALIAEARHARLLPGSGELPLDELLRVLPPDIPLSIEVHDDAARAAHAPDALAAVVAAHTRSWLASRLS